MSNIFEINTVKDTALQVIRTPVRVRTYFYLSTKNKNTKGRCPVVCRVKARGERRDFRTGIFLEPAQWDYKRSWPKDNTDQAEHRLTKIRERIYAVIVTLEAENICSPGIVVQNYLQSRNNKVLTLPEIAEQYISVNKPSDLVKCRIKRDVKLFVEKTGVNIITSVVTEHVQGFIKEMSAQHYSMHSILKKLQHIKRVFNYAENKKYLTTNLFNGFTKPTAPKVHLVHVSPIEVDKLVNHKFASDRLNYVRDLFLFQCNTGLSYADLWVFGENCPAQGAGSKIVNMQGIDYLKGTRVKTGEEFMVPWLPFAMAIAERYSYRFRHICNQKYNSYLKELTDILNIDKRLTTHVGRKTFAQNMINHGYTAEAVSKMMGHSSFDMTQSHYGRIGAERIHTEVVKLRVAS